MLAYARQTSDATLRVHVDSDWAGEPDRGDCEERQTLVATDVMFADASCVILAEKLSTTL